MDRQTTAREWSRVSRTKSTATVTVLTVNPLVGLGYFLQGHALVHRFGVGRADFIVEIRHGRRAACDEKRRVGGGHGEKGTCRETRENGCGEARSIYMSPRRRREDLVVKTVVDRIYREDDCDGYMAAALRVCETESGRVC